MTCGSLQGRELRRNLHDPRSGPHTRPTVWHGYRLSMDCVLWWLGWLAWPLDTLDRWIAAWADT